MEDKNFGVPQISKFIDNLSLFDGSEDAIKAYADKFKSGVRRNLAGYDIDKYKSNMAKVHKF